MLPRMVMAMSIILSPLTLAIQAVASPETTTRILQYLEKDGEDNIVIIDVGQNTGAVNGTVYDCYRATHPSNQSPHKVWIKTGVIKLVDVQDEYSLAKVTEDSTAMSRSFFEYFPGVMAGDVVERRNIQLVAKQVVTPVVAKSYFDLFEDPKAYPTTFEISSAGKDVLRQVAEEFASASVSMLMIEGYTDSNGPADANQLESYQRALSVRDVLVNELGFDPERLVAVGFGEAEQLDGNRVPGYIKENRRIVFKVITNPQHM